MTERSWLQHHHTRSLIAIAVMGGLVGLLSLVLDRSTYPSREAAERILRYALDGGGKVLRRDGAVRTIDKAEIASIDTVDCRKDRRMSVDFPLFACVYEITAGDGQRYMAVVGAMHWRGPDMPTIAGYVVYPRSIADQRAVLEDRGILLPSLGSRQGTNLSADTAGAL